MHMCSCSCSIYVYIVYTVSTYKLHICYSAILFGGPDACVLCCGVCLWYICSLWGECVLCGGVPGEQGLCVALCSISWHAQLHSHWGYSGLPATDQRACLSGVPQDRWGHVWAVSLSLSLSNTHTQTYLHTNCDNSFYLWQPIRKTTNTRLRQQHKNCDHNRCNIAGPDHNLVAKGFTSSNWCFVTCGYPLTFSRFFFIANTQLVPVASFSFSNVNS